MAKRHCIPYRVLAISQCLSVHSRHCGKPRSWLRRIPDNRLATRLGAVPSPNMIGKNTNFVIFFISMPHLDILEKNMGDVPKIGVPLNHPFS